MFCQRGSAPPTGNREPSRARLCCVEDRVTQHTPIFATKRGQRISNISTSRTSRTYDYNNREERERELKVRTTAATKDTARHTVLSPSALTTPGLVGGGRGKCATTPLLAGRRGSP